MLANFRNVLTTKYGDEEFSLTAGASGVPWRAVDAQARASTFVVSVGELLPSGGRPHPKARENALASRDAATQAKAGLAELLRGARSL
jgi:hypothetical protein